MVALIEAVAARLREQLTGVVNEGDIYRQIEASLIDRRQYELAKALILSKIRNDEQEVQAVKLIRRNGKIVPWNSGKIEVAIRKAFLKSKT